LAVVATVALAIGVCVFAASIMDPGPLSGVAWWLLAIGGLGALVAGLAVLWVVFRRRDKSLW
jgi:hypothetical protein